MLYVVEQYFQRGEGGHGKARAQIIRKLSLERTHIPHGYENPDMHRSLRVPRGSGHTVKFIPRTPPRSSPPVRRTSRLNDAVAVRVAVPDFYVRLNRHGAPA